MMSDLWNTQYRWHTFSEFGPFPSLTETRIDFAQLCHRIDDNALRDNGRVLIRYRRFNVVVNVLTRLKLTKEPTESPFVV